LFEFLAVAFGQGCYFARDSMYSHSFASPDRNGIRRMFLGKLDFIAENFIDFFIF